MSKPTCFWDHFSVTVSNPSIFNGHCPLCEAQLIPNVRHVCSNPKPPEPAKKVKKK